MSSLIRRIERQQCASRRKFKNLVTGAIEHAPPRHEYFNGRGSKLGVHNPRDAAKLARVARDRKWGRKP